MHCNTLTYEDTYTQTNKYAHTVYIMYTHMSTYICTHTHMHARTRAHTQHTHIYTNYYRIQQ